MIGPVHYKHKTGNFETVLSLRNVYKTIGQKVVAEKISLEVKKGEFIVLLGPSGCGKTTLLRMISGLDLQTAGDIWIDGRLVNQLSPGDRDVAMVFQNYSLYMHMSVWDNLAFGLKIRKTPKDKIYNRVNAVLDILQIQTLRERKPHQLSGGEKQRVAIGRALVRDPKLYLFDEPLSNLDATLRMELRAEISQLHQQFGTTSIYVTHDQVEAMSMADRLVVLNDGKIMAFGKTEDLYNNPQNMFVAGFLGNPGMNLLTAQLSHQADDPVLLFADNVLPLQSVGIYLDEQLRFAEKESVTVGFRPEAVGLTATGSDDIQIHARVLLVERLGFETQLMVENKVGKFRVRVKEKNRFEIGARVDLYIPRSDFRFFNNRDQQIIRPLHN